MLYPGSFVAVCCAVSWLLCCCVLSDCVYKLASTRVCMQEIFCHADFTKPHDNLTHSLAQHTPARLYIVTESMHMLSSQLGFSAKLQILHFTATLSSSQSLQMHKNCPIPSLVKLETVEIDFLHIVRFTCCQSCSTGVAVCLLQVEAEASSDSNPRQGFVPRQKPGFKIFGKSSSKPAAGKVCFVTHSTNRQAPSHNFPPPPPPILPTTSPPPLPPPPSPLPPPPPLPPFWVACNAWVCPLHAY